MGPVDPVDLVVPVDPVVPGDPVDLLGPVNPINPVDPRTSQHQDWWTAALLQLPRLLGDLSCRGDGGGAEVSEYQSNLSKVM